MDPIGLILEHYDGIGQWRTDDNGEPISNEAAIVHVLRDYGPISGPVEFRDAILSEPDRFVRAATEKLMTYALGRRIEHFDMPAARAIVRAAAEADYRFSSLVLGVVQSEPFMMRVAGGETEVAVNSTSTDRPSPATF